MKKIIAAAAGLMIAGSAMVASAAVEFSGDARARYYFLDNYNFQLDRFGAPAGEQSEDHWRNRVRIKMKGTTAGGSYAVLRLRADNNSWGDSGNGNSIVNTDQAYVGTDFGCVNLEAGRNDYGITTGFWNDANLDQIKLKYSMDETTLLGTYAVTNTNRSVGQQDEDRLITVAWMQGWGEWSTTLAGAYVNQDISRPGGENGGGMADLAFAGPLGPVAVAGEIGWQEDGFVATDERAQGYEFTGDDGFGAYVSLGMEFDAYNPVLVAGMAIDGFVWDLPVGFIMLGGDKIITPSTFGALGAVNVAGGTVAADTYFVGLVNNYQVNEKLGLMFDLAYANVETVTTNLDHDAFEVSGRVTYAVNDGTALKFETGWLTVDGDLIDSDAIGAAVSLELSF